jgi:hypothetical protein
MFEFNLQDSSDDLDELFFQSFENVSLRQNILPKNSIPKSGNKSTEQIDRLFSVALKAYKMNKGLLVDR